MAEPITKTKIRLPFKTIGFAILCLIAVGITVISSIMVSTNFSFGEDPRYTKSFRIDLREDSKTDEKETIVPTMDASGIIISLILEDLPDNVLEGHTSIKEIKIDGDEVYLNGDIVPDNSEFVVDGKLLLSLEKIYKVTYVAYIKYDAANVMLRASLNGVALILIVFGVILYTIDKRKRTDVEYAKQKAKIDDAHGYHRPLVWKKYEDPVNLARKINAWKTICYNKERKLDEKAKEEDLRIYLKGSDEERRANKYCQEKSLVRIMSSDEWINENIEYKYVKYDKINYRLVFIGDSPARGAGESNEYITKNKALIIAFENLPRILIGVGISIIFSLLVVDILKFNITVLVSALTSIANIAWNIYLSNSYGNTFFETRSMWDISFRAGLASEYVSFLNSKMAEIPEPPKLIKEEVKVDVETETEK